MPQLAVVVGYSDRGISPRIDEFISLQSLAWNSRSWGFYDEAEILAYDLNISSRNDLL